MDYAFGGFMAVARSKDRSALLPKFLFYNLSGQRFRDHLGFAVDSSTINNLNARVIGSFQFPLPSVEVQKRVINILDNFCTISTDLTTGIPAEIRARNHQYEYYRDKLLMFEVQ